MTASDHCSSRKKLLQVGGHPHMRRPYSGSSRSLNRLSRSAIKAFRLSVVVGSETCCISLCACSSFSWRWAMASLYHSSHHSCLYKTRERRKCSVPAWLRRCPEFPGKPSHGSRFHGVARNDFVVYEVARRTFEQAMLKADRTPADASKHHSRRAVRTARALDGCELRTG